MKLRNLISITVLVILFTGGFILVKAQFDAKTQQALTTATTITAPEQEVLGEQKNTISIPKKLIIPKIQIDTEVEHVGLDKQGRMDVPKEVMNVAWYQLGSSVGKAGNAVLAGHFDDPNGNPAVFYKLNSLENGDTIQVVGDDNNIYTYKVTEKRTYETDKFPLNEVFGLTSKSRLNLITCEGVFNKSESSYSHRLVVYSELVE